MNTRPCDYCGQEIPITHGKRRFCDRHCASRYHHLKQVHTCVICHAPLANPRLEVCSLECAKERNRQRDKRFGVTS